MNKFDPTVDKRFDGDIKDSKYSFELKKTGQKFNISCLSSTLEIYRKC